MNPRHSAPPAPVAFPATGMAGHTCARAPEAVRLVLVGGGPRAIGVLERLAASAAEPGAAAQLDAAPLHIDLVDPHMPGAGRIWRAEESPLLLMNSRAEDVSIFTDETVACAGPVVAGPSLAEWADGIRRGEITAPTTGTARLAEIHALGPTDFASRRVQALYLEWFFGQVLAALPATVSLTVHRTTATAVRPVGEGAAADGDSAADGLFAADGDTGTDGGAFAALTAASAAPRWRVELEDRAPLEAHLLLLAAGHTDSRPTGARHRLAAFARRHAATYIAPGQAGDLPLEQLAPGEDVIVRGMGLGFIDVMALLTEGRGGSFTPDPRPGEPGRLHYLPSGREPRLWVGSRRGVPYHSKVTDEGAPAGLTALAHVTAEALRAREDEDGRLDFHTDVLPLIAAEIHHQVPGAPAPAPGDAPLAWLDDPLSWLSGDAHPQVTRDAVVRHITHDLRSRTRGDLTPARALFQLLLRLHGTLVDLLPPERLRGGADGGYPRRWHSLFSFIASGPPPHRLEQLLALERAGLVHFLGPRLRLTADEAAGTFTARGAAGVHVTAGALIDAFLPEPALAESTNPLLRKLVTGGEAAVGRESVSSPGTLDVDERSRVLGPDGSVRSGLWAIGAWTSELPLGAFARPRTNAPCHRRNDAVARELLAAAARIGDARREVTAVTPEVSTLNSATAGLLPRARRLGVLGPGKIGSALTRAALRRGLEVSVTGRSPARTLAARLPGASPVGLSELVATSEVLALTIPLHVALGLDPAALQGAVVVDATNPWGEADDSAIAQARHDLGDLAGALSTSELLAARLPGVHVVKTFNHIGYHDVEDHGREEGDPARRALAVAADDSRAADRVATLLHRLGFEPVLLGDLAAGRDLEPGRPLFTGWTTAAELDHRRTAQLPAA